MLTFHGLWSRRCHKLLLRGCSFDVMSVVVDDGSVLWGSLAAVLPAFWLCMFMHGNTGTYALGEVPEQSDTAKCNLLQMETQYCFDLNGSDRNTSTGGDDPFRMAASVFVKSKCEKGL